MRIKYMGSSDIRTIKKGADFGGTLAPEVALSEDLEWNEDGKFVLDTSDHEGVSDEFWQELVSNDATKDEFKDVSDLKRIPPSDGQKLWRGMKESRPNPHVEVAEGGVAGEGDDASSAGDATTTTVGGSTRGAKARSGRST